MDQNINLNYYKVFYYVALYKSFNKASQYLCVSQPALSKQIKNLEEDLDVKLFYRFNNGIQLTDEGKILFEYIEKVNFYLESSKKSMIESKKLMIGDLVIGCPSHIASFYLLKYISKFKKKYKNINIKIISDNTEGLIDKLYHHKIDFLIDSLPIDIDKEIMEMRDLIEFDSILITSNKRDCQIKKCEDLSGKSLILPLERSSFRLSFEKFMSKFNINYNVGISVDTTDLIINSVLHNLGIGYVIKQSVEKELKDKLLYEIKLNVVLPKVIVKLIYEKSYLSHISKVFLEEFINISI